MVEEYIYFPSVQDVAISMKEQPTCEQKTVVFPIENSMHISCKFVRNKLIINYDLIKIIFLKEITCVLQVAYCNVCLYERETVKQACMELHLLTNTMRNLNVKLSTPKCMCSLEGRRVDGAGRGRGAHALFVYSSLRTYVSRSCEGGVLFPEFQRRQGSMISLRYSFATQSLFTRHRRSLADLPRRFCRRPPAFGYFCSRRSASVSCVLSFADFTKRGLKCQNSCPKQGRRRTRQFRLLLLPVSSSIYNRISAKHSLDIQH